MRRNIFLVSGLPRLISSRRIWKPGMCRKTVLVSLALFLVFIGASMTTLYILIKDEPSFYLAATMPEGKERTLQSGEFLKGYTNLMSDIYNRYPDWGEMFTTGQINAFLQQDFVSSYGGDNNLPDGFRDLRVQVEDGLLRLGCRYGKGFWSTTISVDLKMWLVANEVNLIGVELVNLRAGGLPISRQMVLDYITDAALRNNIDVKWYHRKNNPVGVLKLQADQVRPTLQIQRFELKAGKIIIVGRSIDGHINPKK